MTLRVRLLLGRSCSRRCLAVAAGVTYSQTRGDLLSRVNKQLAFRFPVSRDLLQWRPRKCRDSRRTLPPEPLAQLRTADTNEVLLTNPGSIRRRPRRYPRWSDSERGIATIR